MGIFSGAAHRSLAIRPSKIHGHGVFACRSFRKGEYIATIKGSKVIYKSYYRGQSNRYPDWIGMGHNTWIDPVDEFQYINHSCDPNVGVMGSRALKAYALRNIQEGEELTIDYSIIEGDSDFIFENNEPKHDKYRQYIGSIHSLPEEVFRSYLPFVPSYFKKLYEKEVLLGHGEHKTGK
jgi:uncharacterized protein